MEHEQPASLEKFTLRDESGTMCTASFEIVLYTSKPKSEAGEGAITCYELFLERFGKSLTWYLASSMRKAKKFSQKNADIFPTLCREPKDRVFSAVLPRIQWQWNAGLSAAGVCHIERRW